MKKFYLFTIGLLGLFVTSNGQQVIELIGTGMVGQSSATLTFSNPDNITAITLGALYKSNPGTVHEGDVTFADADEGPSSTWMDYTNIVDKNPITTNETIGYWSENFTTADAGGIQVVITDVDDEPYVKAAYAYLYRTLPYTPSYTSYLSFETVFFYHNGSGPDNGQEGVYVYTVPIDAASNPRDITVKIPIAELDETQRNVVIDIEAGPVTLHAEETTWNYGESFFIGTYTLNDVPGTVTSVSVSIYSPTWDEGNGDSFFTNGVLVDVDNDCGECDGQITSLDLQYLGDEVDATIKVYTRKVEPNKLLATFTNVNNGDILSFVGDPTKQNKMGPKIRITVNDGNAYTEIHTSCSQDIYAGMVFGDYLILAGTSHEGGPLCSIDPPPPGDDCGECEGQVTSLDLEYQGAEVDATIKVYTKKVSPNNLLATFTDVNDGDILSFVGDPTKQNKMGPKIRITVEGVNGYTEIHTSCSQDIYVGMVFGDYEVVAGTSHGGGPLCVYDPNKSASANIGDKSAGLLVYPNPMSTSGSLNFIAAEDAPTTIEVYNLLGTKVDVLLNNYLEAGSKTSLSIDATKYPKGMYIVVIRNGSSIFKEKLSVMN